MNVLLLAGGAIGLGLAFSKLKKPSTPAPATTPLRTGQPYRLSVRQSLGSRTFGRAGVDHAQAILGKQGFAVRGDLSFPDATDPFVVRIKGVYRGLPEGGGDGPLFDAPPSLFILGQPAEDSSIPTDDPVSGIHYENLHGPISLTPGVQYFGRASVSFPLSLLISEGKIVSALASRGFSDIRVETDASKLPPDWPATERGGDYFVIATYTGDPGATFNAPSQVLAVWEPTS